MEYNKIKKCLIAGYDLDIITQEEIGILWNYITNLQEQIKATEEVSAEYIKRNDKAIKIICKYGRDKQLEEDYLMNRVNLANYNCLLLDILQGEDKE